MKIKHTKVNEYYNYLKESFANVNLSEEHRMEWIFIKKLR